MTKSTPYHLLRGLYFGSAANADITDQEGRARLHVATPLDQAVPRFVREGRDVVLTGNPGDGKSHLTRALADLGGLTGAEVELDLSAKEPEQVVSRWEAAAARGAPFVLCGNEGPLKDLLPLLRESEVLTHRATELGGQLGRLVCSRDEDLPSEPRFVYLIDLADRNILERGLVDRCLERVCAYEFMPHLKGVDAAESSAGQNIAMFSQAPRARQRLALILELAGRRMDKHVTFRQLWSAISFALTGDKDERALRIEAKRGEAGLGTLPLDHLCELRSSGLLVSGVKRLADPADAPVPDLDEALWSKGSPRRGDWLYDAISTPPPSHLWARGEKEEALRAFKRLKRHIALAHEEGERILQVLQDSDPYLPTTLRDEVLLKTSIEGIRALFLPPGQQAIAPSWLVEGVPLWVSHSYRGIPRSRRPHVATDHLPASEFRILRPRRAPWLGDALGPDPEVAWLQHIASRVTLALGADLLRVLTVAARCDGPLRTPEVAGRFLERLAGWQEAHGSLPLGDDSFVVLSHPRGQLVAHASVREHLNGAFEYV